MTEPITETPDSPSEIDANGSSTDPVVETPENDAPKGNREARYRTERNDARTERDALAARVEALNLRELERVAGKHLSAPKDLLTLSARQLGDFITDAGDVNPELVASVAAEVLATRPGLRRSQPATDPTQGHHSGTPKLKPTFQALFNS
jgi:hypothetical protein